MIRSKTTPLLAAGALGLFLAATPTAQAGFAMSGYDSITTSQGVEVRIPEAGVNNGISHELSPGSYTSYRVRVKHDDSNGPGWLSDEMAPTSGNIQLCQDSGCEAPRIVVGNSSLDWDNASKIHFFLEAKPGPLQAWEQYAL